MRDRCRSLGLRPLDPLAALGRGVVAFRGLLVRLLAVALSMLVVLGLVAGAATAQQRIALVIGNSAYDEMPLRNPVNDAGLIAAALRGLGFQVDERLDVDREGFEQAISAFGERLEGAGRDAVGLFYYAGHGVQVNGRNYLIPLDAQIAGERDVRFQAVGADDVIRTMAFAYNRLNIVILGSCRNNPYAGRFRSLTRGLAPMDAPSGTLVAYATAPGAAAEDGDGDNSPYAAALARTMPKPGLLLGQVFNRVRAFVRDETERRQTPWEESSLMGDFYFVAGEPRSGPARNGPPVAVAENPRMEVVVYKYRGIVTEEQKIAFEEFKAMIHDRILTLAEELSARGKEFEYLLELKPSFLRVPFEGSAGDLHRAWDRNRALELFSGMLRSSQGKHSVESRVFLGGLKGDLERASIKLDLRIDPADFRKTANTHILATLYALAVDARRLGYPSNVVLALFGEANAHAATIRGDKAQVEPIRAAIRRALEGAVAQIR